MRAHKDMSATKKNPIAIIGLVCGIVGAVLSPVPFINLLSFPLTILALVFGILGLRNCTRGAGKAIQAGLAVLLGIGGLIAVSIMGWGLLLAVFGLR